MSLPGQKKLRTYTTLLVVAAGWLYACHCLIGHIGQYPSLVEAAVSGRAGHEDLRQGCITGTATALEAGMQPATTTAPYLRMAGRRSMAGNGFRPGEGNAAPADHRAVPSKITLCFHHKNSFPAPFQQRDYYVVGLRHLII